MSILFILALVLATVFAALGVMSSNIKYQGIALIFAIVAIALIGYPSFIHS